MASEKERDERIEEKYFDRTPFQEKMDYAFDTLKRSPVGIIGLVIVLLVIIFAILGPSITPFDPGQYDLQARFKPPGFVSENGTHILGTDQLGRDILSRIIIGCRVSLIIGLISAVVGSTVGVTYGLISGFSGGPVDMLMMRVADAFLGIPYIVLVVAVSGILGPGLFTLILILGVTDWVTYARVTRGQVLVVRELEYITAAKAIGQKKSKIAFFHVLPNVLTSAITLTAMRVGTVILAESALSFIGLGVQPPTITWGLILSDGRQYLGSAWWMTTFPGLAITITVLGVVFLGDWIRDVLDPSLRGSM